MLFYRLLHGYGCRQKLLLEQLHAQHTVTCCRQDVCTGDILHTTLFAHHREQRNCPCFARSGLTSTVCSRDPSEDDWITSNQDPAAGTYHAYLGPELGVSADYPNS